jgi:hypothetical protein
VFARQDEDANAITIQKKLRMLLGLVEQAEEVDDRINDLHRMRYLSQELEDAITFSSNVPQTNEEETTEVSATTDLRPNDADSLADREDEGEAVAWLSDGANNGCKISRHELFETDSIASDRLAANEQDKDILCDPQELGPGYSNVETPQYGKDDGGAQFSSGAETEVGNWSGDGKEGCEKLKPRLIAVALILALPLGEVLLY